MKRKKNKLLLEGCKRRKTCGGAFISLQSDIVARHSNTRDLTEIPLQRDELKKQCESLAKHLEETHLVVSNLKKKLTTTFQDRATSARTGRRRLRIRRYH